jgi:hypothetical protein
LLSDSRRVIALARYGLADHTPNQRRGGLELIGVVCSSSLDVTSALSIYGWLQLRRDAVEDLHQLGGRYSLAEIRSSASPPPRTNDPVPVLPVRLWQEGALLFAASSPTDSDHHLGLLEQATGTNWQWLSLVGPDFPLPSYARRGPLIAWTPNLAGVAVKLEHRSTDTPLVPPTRTGHGMRLTVGGLLLLIIGLLGANLWSLLSLRHSLSGLSLPEHSQSENPPPLSAQTKKLTSGEEMGKDRFLAAMHELLIERGGDREWKAEKNRLLARYERLVRTHKELRVLDDSEQDKLTVAAISVLAERSADRIEDEVRKALGKQVFSDRLIKAVCDHVHEHFVAEVKEEP